MLSVVNFKMLKFLRTLRVVILVASDGPDVGAATGSSDLLECLNTCTWLWLEHPLALS